MVPTPCTTGPHLSLLIIAVLATFATAAIGVPSLVALEDATALLQQSPNTLDIELEGDEELSPPGQEPKKGYNEDEDGSVSIGFPLITEDDYHFVASASYNVDYANFHVHAYDLALYLKNSSRLWNVDLSREQVITEMVDQCSFHLHMTTRWVSRHLMADFVQKLIPLVQDTPEEHPNDMLEDYRRRFLEGPKVVKGTKLTITPVSEGVRLTVDKTDLGVVSSKYLGRVSVDAYIGTRTDFPDFREQVFSQLRSGRADAVTDAVQIREAVKTEWWKILILVIILVAIVAAAVGCVWYCCCRRKATEAAKAEPPAEAPAEAAKAK
mmetsp:Transcript_18321/g.58272  ORF Transcript_18321/g.58272 Transcript_18321/m.58272 type:complete len:324 (+) Transcript_18321:77-1048(+)